MAKCAHNGWIWAFAAGASASMSAVLAKSLAATQMIWQYRLGGYGAVLLLNVIMWSAYVRSLRALTSLQATVVNFASNFLLSGIAGFLCFREALHFRWFLGASLILAGIYILSKADKGTEKNIAKEKHV